MARIRSPAAPRRRHCVYACLYVGIARHYNPGILVCVFRVCVCVRARTSVFLDSDLSSSLRRFSAPSASICANSPRIE